MAEKNTGRKYLLYEMFSPIIARSLAGGGIPSVEELQDKYAFSYYSTMNKAVTDVNNGAIGANADSTKDSAVAGVYTNENGGKNVVLLKDTTETKRIIISADMTLNLGGHTLSANDAVCLNITSGNVSIDGRLSGSSIEMNRESSSLCVQMPAASTATLNVCGGAYVTNSSISTAIAFNCINLGNKTFSNCTILSSSKGGISRAVLAKGHTTINNSNLRAYSNYATGSDGSFGSNNGAVYSDGVWFSDGTLRVNNCRVFGTFSGITAKTATMNINGGTYESFGHGGLYCDNNSISYVRNANVRACGMPDGYTATSHSNGAGFYIGEGSDIPVYMDNCDIYGSAVPIVLRGSAGEQNNSLYISNSRINLDYANTGVRIDNDTHKLYLGAGNNFTAENTNRPSAVVVTNEVYAEGA